MVGNRVAQRAQFRGSLLRRLREARGLSQEALAVALGVNRFSLSKWENERNQPDPRFHPHIIEKITEYFGVPEGYFYASLEHTSVNADVVFSHLATFTDLTSVVFSARERILTFLTDGPKAPVWWREQLGAYIKTTKPQIRYIVILCIDPGAVTQSVVEGVDAANAECAGAVDVYIVNQRSPLGIDVMVVDTEHVFLGLQAINQGPRQCVIHLTNRTVASTLEEWMFHLVDRADRYEEWRKAVVHLIGSSSPTSRR
jgi:transcriptional regulator with XRE-family HTH domain